MCALDHAPVADKTDLSVSDVTAARILSLKPCYDFFAPLRPVPVMDPRTKQPVMVAPGVPQMGMARDPIVTGRDFAMHPHPVHITLGPGVFFDFFSQMHATDKKTYTEFIDAARGATTVHRAEKAGIVAPNGGDLAVMRGGRGRPT